jgi:tetratricopeptide (TPR) repeat protein
VPKKFLLIRAVISLCILGGVFSSPNLLAQEEFEKRFRAYQSEVNTTTIAFNKKDYQTAVSHFSKAIEVSPFEAFSYYQRGIALYKSGKEKEVIEDFDKVLILDSRMISAYVYRGLCREKTGEYLEALKDFTSALALNPEDASIHNNLAWLYATAEDEKIQDKAKTLEHAKKAAELSRENNAEILDTLARAYFINGQVKDAIETENKALKLTPENHEFKPNFDR